jgi:T5SS/PEP-CTERM-associated repeat protein
MVREILSAIGLRLRSLIRRRALCPVSTRIAARALVTAMALAMSKTASASILFTGNVLPADNPFTEADEGIPTDGNFINTSEAANEQTFFEGRHLDNNLLDPDDDNNENFSITVGQTSLGTLVISLGDVLRDQDLVIGDSGLINGLTRVGTGVVRLTGLGTLYNNDPFIIPPGLPANFQSKTPRPTDVGYDVYVGRAGTGTLEITVGARAEIQDAVIIADQPGSVGTLIVDGLDSFLGSGGFEASATGEVHQFIVGRQGTGYMTISAGGTVASEAPPAAAGGGSDVPSIGAVIGGEPVEQSVEQEPGGQGVATVTGPASKWIIGGSLQIGGFNFGATGDPTAPDDFEGDEAQYNSEAGRGTLHVNDGALVNVRTAIGEDTNDDDDLLVMIGRFGRLEMDGGRVVVGAADAGTGGNGASRSDSIQIINDGLIKGSGRIDTGVFRNRYLGQIRVEAGDTLIIDSSSEFIDTELEPLTSFGLIEVVGTVEQRAEIEFIRSPADDQFPLRPFFNFALDPVAAPPPRSFEGGVINAAHSTLRFGSGVVNTGVMAFTAGYNIITGQVDNVAGTTNGRFLISRNTDVVVEGDFSTGGIIDPLPPDAPILTLGEGSTLTILDHSSFTMAGHLDMEVSLTNPSRIEVGGDVGLDGDLFVSFAPDAISALSHGDAFELIYFAGFIGGVDFTDPTHPIPDLTINPVLNVVPDATFNLLFPNLDLIAVQILQSYYLVAIDPTMVGPGGGPGAIGPDFNGDGVVDADDLAIWQANVGLTTGASVVQGDADGDGDVDGDDFLFWQRNVGMPPPWTGAGSGSGNGSSSTIPEPSALLLLALGGMLAGGYRRRRAQR